MMDMGLRAGALSLWEDEVLCDYTIRVEKREFRVHKVVLASVSEYFRAMLGGSMKESKTDRVELKELSAEAVSTIIDMIYTGDESLMNENTAELLKCAVYLQIQPAISACTKKLIADLNEKNWIETLSMFTELGFKDEIESMRSYVKTEWMSVVKNCKLEEQSYEVLQVVIGLWKKSELELFQCVKDWVDVDYENRKQYLNDLMHNVRFSLMTRKELTRVKRYFIYKKSTGSWKALVDKAYTYHDLPMHQKVLDLSEQSKVRSDPAPVMFSSYCEGNIYFREHPRTMYTLDEEYRWTGHANDENDAPYFENDIEQIIVVNNFLICCPSSWERKGEEGHSWYIFDPRTMSWSVMPSTSSPKSNFALVHHNKYLYVLGGHGSTSYTDEVELYSFESNSWSFGTKMPAGISYHRACVHGNAVYVTGGQEAARLPKSTRFDRFDLTSQTWESLPPLLNGTADHHMYVMKICHKDAIVMCEKHGEEDKDSVQLYDFETNQWSRYQCSSPGLFHADFDYDRPRMSTGCIYTLRVFTYVRGNTVYSVRFLKPGTNPYGYNGGPVIYISKRWDIPEDGGKPTEVTFESLPLHPDYVNLDGKLYGGLLSMLPSIRPKN